MQKPIQQSSGQLAAKPTMSRLGWFIAILVAFVCAEALWLSAYADYQGEVFVYDSDQHNQRKAFPKARELAKQAIAFNRYNGYAYYLLGANEYLLDHYGPAIENLNLALRFIPHQTNVLRVLAQACFQHKQYADAVRSMERYFHMDPAPRSSADEMHSLRGQALYRAEFYGPAAVHLATAETYPTYRAILLQTRLSDALLMNQINMADYIYRRFRRACPKEQIAFKELFSGALYTGRLQSMLRFFEIMRMRGDVDSETLQYLALAYIKADRLDEAIMVLKEALRYSPNDPNVYLFFGDIYFKRSDLPNARENYRKHLELNPQSPYRPDILQKLGDKL
jgi:tetratricopeptide (TPR) repeat protein